MGYKKTPRPKEANELINYGNSKGKNKGNF